MKVRSIAAAMLALAVVATASAHQGMHGPAAKFDVDGDGRLSLQEYTAYLDANKLDVTTAAARFAELDTNKNNFVSSAEFMRGQPKKTAKE